MLVGTPNGQMAITSGSVANLPGGASGSGGAGPVSNQTAATYAAPLTENGYTYTNAGGAGITEIQMPANAPIGYTAAIAQTNGGQVIRVKMPTGEVLWIGGAPSSSGGTLATGADGAFISFRKVLSNRWQVFATAGTVGTLT